MMKKIAILLATLLLLGMFPLTAMAQDEAGATAVPMDSVPTVDPQASGSVTLALDNKNLYEGMDRTYWDGYTPQTADGSVSVILPLVANGAILGDVLTATPDLGEAASSPFVYRNYQRTVSLASVPVNEGTATVDAYLVRFDLPLSPDRVNGVYPVTIQLQAQTAGGSQIQQSFTVYVTINDGFNPNPTQVVEQTDPPVSQPKIIVSGYSAEPSPVIAGEDFTVKVTLYNTSQAVPVQNMAVTAACDSPDFTLKNASDTIYIGRLGRGQTTQVEFTYSTDLDTPAQRYNISLAIGYDNPDAQSLSANAAVTVTVHQPLRVEMETPSVTGQIYAGDTIPLSLQVMNMGRSQAYNVRVSLSAPGLFPIGEAFIGNMEAGTAATGELTVFVGTRDMTQGHESDEKYGQTDGIFTVTCEDADGQTYTQTLPFSVTIQQPVAATVADTQPEDTPERAGQWWISVVIGGSVIAGLTALLIYRTRRRRSSHASV